MIRFEVQNGNLVPIEEQGNSTQNYIAKEIANRLNGVSTGVTDYKSLMKALDEQLSKGNYYYKDYVDDQTIKEIEDFYVKAAGIKPWDSSKQGADITKFDSKFYSGLVPDKVQSWKDASKSVSFGGKKIPDVDITRTYTTLDDYLHSDYTFVGAPSGLPGTKREFDTYTETLRAPTNQEQQILRETILGKTADKPESLAELATQDFVDKQGERAFGALTTDVLKQTLDEYKRAIKQEQMADILQGMGMPNVTDFKSDIKNAILGDLGGGGFLSLSKDSKFGKGLSESLDKSLGMGSSVSYNWQKWFDETLAERYKNMSEIADPKDAQKTYALEQEFVNDFVNDYLKPRFDTSKSITEFISYMDVKEDEQNVLQTQLVSSALKDFANKQAQTYIDGLRTASTTKEFDPKFYWNPELISGTDVTSKQSLYQQQKENVQSAWDARESDQAVTDGKTWNQLAYEYGVDLNNKDDFARLHYQVLGKNKGYDPVADTYTRQDLADFIQNDLAKALESEKASFGNPIFAEFVSAESKAAELVDKMNVAGLSPELQDRLKGLGMSTKDNPVDQIKEALTQILSTDPAAEMRERIRQLNEQRIKPTQKELGYGYIQRDTDEEITPPAGGSALFNVFKKAGYGGTESEFYTEFFPDATEEDKSLSAADVGKASTKEGAMSLLGFSMPDMSDPFAAIGSLGSMLDTDDTSKAETYTPKRSTYFKYFEDEEDEGAPSYFNMGTGSSFGSLLGSI